MICELFSREERFMSVTFSDDVLKQTHMTNEELAVETALHLFQIDKLSFGQAARMAAMNHLEFQKLLGRRQIALHYDVEELRKDVETLQKAGRL
jgi:predicted HTH domain antitoxin